VATSAPAAGRPSAERQWWLRTLAVFQSPSTVFAALRNESDEDAGARQEPLLALLLLAGVAAILAWSPTTGRLLDDPRVDGALVAVLTFLGGALYGIATYWLGGAALYLGARGAGSRGSYRRARHILAFAAAPLALMLLLVWPLRLAVYGSDVFRTGGADATSSGRWVFVGLDLLFLVWALTLLVLGLRSVEGWKTVRALGSVALAGLAVLAFTLPFVIPLSTR
jgi:hypothetical protein